MGDGDAAAREVGEADRAPRPLRRFARWARGHWAWLLTVLVYFYATPLYPKLNNPNENVRFYMTAAMVEQGTYRIDEMRRRWGWVNDASVYEGHYYSVKAPGTSWLGVPGYALYRWWAGEHFDRWEALRWVRRSSTTLPVLVFLAFFWGWLRRQGFAPWVADAMLLSVALGSPLLGYALLNASHATAAAALTVAFALLFEAGQGARPSHLRAFVAGLCTAAVTFFDYHGLVASVLLALWALVVLRPWSRWPAFVLGGLLPTAAVAHFHWRAFGNPLTPGHRYLENRGLLQFHDKGLYGVTSLHPEAMWRLLVDPRWGLLTTAPWVLLALWGGLRMLRRRRGSSWPRGAALVAWATVLGTYLAVSLLVHYWGGWSLGPRYLTEVLPLLGWMGAWALSQPGEDAAEGATEPASRRWPWWAAGLSLAGLLLGGLPSLYYPHIPESLRWPWPWLYATLLSLDFAPFNLGRDLLGLRGTASMLPVFAAMLGGWVVAWRSWRARGRLVGALLVAAAVFSAFWWPAPPPDGKARRALALVTRTWAPAGEDAPSRLAARLAREGGGAAEWSRLAAMWRRIGREREARAAERRAAAMRRSTP